MKNNKLKVLFALLICVVAFTACGTKPEDRAKRNSEKRTNAVERQLDSAFQGMELRLKFAAKVSLNQDGTIQIQEIKNADKPDEPGSQGAALTANFLDVLDDKQTEYFKEFQEKGEVITIKLVRRDSKLFVYGFSGGSISYEILD